MKKWKNKIYFLAILIIIVVVIIPFMRSRTAEDYLLSHYENATEILYHDSSSEGYEILFFFEDSGYVSCALLERTWSGYRIVRISGKSSLSYPGYLCSYFRDDHDSLWIDWGVITDNNIKSVWADSEEMKMVECKPYSYRICWLIGSGEGPQNHIEKK